MFTHCVYVIQNVVKAYQSICINFRPFNMNCKQSMHTHNPLKFFTVKTKSKIDNNNNNNNEKKMNHEY